MTISKKKREEFRDNAIKRSQYLALQRSENKEKILEKEEKIKKYIKPQKSQLQKALECCKWIIDKHEHDVNVREKLYAKSKNIILLLNKKSSKIVNEINRVELSTIYRDNNNIYLNIIFFLSQVDWIRDLSKWEIKGKSSLTQIKSLIFHLVGKYEIPKFLYNIFDDSKDTKRFYAIFVHLIQGGGMKAARKAGLLKATMTQKMDHIFLQSDPSLKFIEAIRKAQVLALGGNERLAKIINSILNNFYLNYIDIFLHDEFWVSVIQWLCNQPMFDYNQINPIMDWFRTKVLDKNFTLKGRTINSVLNDVHQWHNELNTKKSISPTTYKSSGLKEWPIEELNNNPPICWRITEILSSEDLLKEGRVMKHCVASYSSSILYGKTSIWSYQFLEQKTLTIEVSNKEKKVVQIRGKCNRRADPSELNKIKMWAKENNLIVNDYV